MYNRNWFLSQNIHSCWLCAYTQTQYNSHRQANQPHLDSWETTRSQMKLAEGYNSDVTPISLERCLPHPQQTCQLGITLSNAGRGHLGSLPALLLGSAKMVSFFLALPLCLL